MDDMGTRHDDVIDLLDNATTFKLVELIAQLNLSRSKTNLSFSQSQIITSPDLNNFSQLKTIHTRFNGLCELISNCVIKDDLLGKQTPSLTKKLLSIDNYLKENLSYNEVINKTFTLLLSEADSPYKNALTLERINEASSTHLLDTQSSLKKITAYFFNTYCYDLFGEEEIFKKGSVDIALLNQKLSSLDNNRYIKFSVLKKMWYGFQGHSMVIKKTNDSYSFFDPNTGESNNLSISELHRKIVVVLSSDNYSGVLFMDGDEYIKNHFPSVIRATATTSALNEKKIKDFIFSNLETLINLADTNPQTLIETINDFRIKLEQALNISPSPNSSAHELSAKTELRTKLNTSLKLRKLLAASSTPPLSESINTLSELTIAMKIYDNEIFVSLISWKKINELIKQPEQLNLIYQYILHFPFEPNIQENFIHILSVLDYAVFTNMTQISQLITLKQVAKRVPAYSEIHQRLNIKFNEQLMALIHSSNHFTSNSADFYDLMMSITPDEHKDIALVISTKQPNFLTKLEVNSISKPALALYLSLFSEDKIDGLIDSMENKFIAMSNEVIHRLLINGSSLNYSDRIIMTKYLDKNFAKLILTLQELNDFTHIDMLSNFVSKEQWGALCRSFNNEILTVLLAKIKKSKDIFIPQAYLLDYLKVIKDNSGAFSQIVHSMQPLSLDVLGKISGFLTKQEFQQFHSQHTALFAAPFMALFDINRTLEVFESEEKSNEYFKLIQHKIKELISNTKDLDLLIELYRSKALSHQPTVRALLKEPIKRLIQNKLTLTPISTSKQIESNLITALLEREPSQIKIQFDNLVAQHKMTSHRTVFPFFKNQLTDDALIKGLINLGPNILLDLATALNIEAYESQKDTLTDFIGEPLHYYLNHSSEDTTPPAPSA